MQKKILKLIYLNKLIFIYNYIIKQIVFKENTIIKL